MSLLLEAASPFLLLVPGFLPLIFFVHRRLVPCPPLDKPAPIIFIFVSLLGPLAALASALGIAFLALPSHQWYIQTAEHVVQSFVELAYRISILYLVTPCSFVVLASRISLSHKEIYRHNILLGIIILSTFILSIAQASLGPSMFSNAVPLSFGIFASVYPIPLVIHLSMSAKSSRVQRIWLFVTIIQTMSAIALSLRFLQGAIYALFSALFSICWSGGIITLFYTLSSAPLPLPAPPPLRFPQISILYSEPSTPTCVHYESSHMYRSSRLTISEDFTALRDPFASPPPVSPISMTSPRTPSPLPPPPLPSHIMLNPPPTPDVKMHKPPRPKAREINPPRRTATAIIEKSTNGSDKTRRVSSQSMQPLARKEGSEIWNETGSGSENARFLSDEAFLSQILLNSLIKEAEQEKNQQYMSSDISLASASAPVLCSDSLMRSNSVSESATTTGFGSTSLERKHTALSTCTTTNTCDVISFATIRTRHDENGRRYALEEERHSGPNYTASIDTSTIPNLCKTRDSVDIAVVPLAVQSSLGKSSGFQGKESSLGVSEIVRETAGKTPVKEILGKGGAWWVK